VDLILLFFLTFIGIALLIYLLIIISFFHSLFNSCSRPIIITVNFVKFFKTILSYDTSSIIIRNGAVSKSLNIVWFNIKFLLNLFELLFVKLIDTFEDLTFHHASSLWTRFSTHTCVDRHDI
jgi:hypothetical protein